MVPVDTEYVSVTEDPGPCILIDGNGRVPWARMDQDIVADWGDAEANPNLDEGTVTQLTTRLGESRNRAA